MWSVKTLPKASVSSAGGCFGVFEVLIAIWVNAVSWILVEQWRPHYSRSAARLMPCRCDPSPNPLLQGVGENGTDYRFARVTICVGLTKRSAISSQISVVIM
jgi:hypothetical protein